MLSPWLHCITWQLCSNARTSNEANNKSQLNIIPSIKPPAKTADKWQQTLFWTCNLPMDIRVTEDPCPQCILCKSYLISYQGYLDKTLNKHWIKKICLELNSFVWEFKSSFKLTFRKKYFSFFIFHCCFDWVCLIIWVMNMMFSSEQWAVISADSCLH